jgi:hypothetical protein
MSGSSCVRLFRAVSPQELVDLFGLGRFRPIPGSMQGKWFAETPDNAASWGQSFSRMLGGTFHLVQVDIPQDVAAKMFRVSSLDQIGPARYAEGDVLDLVNQSHQGIVEVPLTAFGGP